MSCPATSQVFQSRPVLADLVSLDIEVEMNPGVELPVRLLGLELPIYFGEHQVHGLRPSIAAGITLCDAGNDDLVHLDDEEVFLPFASLAECDGGFLQVL